MEPQEQQINQQTVDTQTGQASMQVQENIQPEVVNQNHQESPLEDSTTTVSGQEGIEQQPIENKNAVEGKPMVSDEIQRKLDKLAEYELKDNELTELKQRLGTSVPQDTVIFGAQQQLGIIENQAQQEYIRLCNAYGVDYRPEMIDKSGEELRAKDPQAFYDLQFKLNNLLADTNAKRQQVNNFILQRDINLALERHKQVLAASPTINNIVNGYIQQGMVNGTDINNIVQQAVTIANEAFEMGRQAVLNEKKTVTPAQVLNNNVITQQASTPVEQTHGLTLNDVANMSIEEYAKNQKVIDKLFQEGKLN